MFVRFRFPFCRFRLALGLVVETLGDLFGVTLVIELHESSEDFPSSRFADREPSTLLRNYLRTNVYPVSYLVV